MKILYRYLLGRVVLSTLAAVTILTLVLVMGNAFKRIFDLFVNNEIPLSTILYMVTLLIPQVLTFTLPWGLLVGVLIVLGRASKDMELQAVYGAGIGLAPLVSPIILLSLFLSLICFYNNAALAPQCMTSFKYTLADLGRNNPTAFLRAGEPVDKFPGFRIYVGAKKGNEIRDVYIWELYDNLVPKRTIRADRGVLAADISEKILTITLFNARQEERPSQDKEFGTVYTGLRAQQLPLTVSLAGVLDTSSIQRKLSNNTFVQLGSKLFGARPENLNIISLFTEVQKRMAISLAPFTLVLVGIPLAIQFQRRETSVGIVLGLSIAIAYYLLVILAEAFKDSAGAYPELIVWSPNILFQILGFVLLWRANFYQA